MARIKDASSYLKRSELKVNLPTPNDLIKKKSESKLTSWKENAREWVWEYYRRAATVDNRQALLTTASPETAAGLAGRRTKVVPGEPWANCHREQRGVWRPGAPLTFRHY